MNTIVLKEVLSPSIKKYVIDNPDIAAKAEAGQFVILRIHEKGERIPLTIADFNRENGTVTIIFQEVGNTTKRLGKLEVGDKILDFVGPLGVPTTPPEGKNYVCIGGGVGIAPIYPEAKALHKQGKQVKGILGGRSKEVLFYEEEMGKVCDELHIATDDGSVGHKGFVTDILKELITDDSVQIDGVIAVGPLPMMKAVCDITKEFNIPTTVSLNSLMVDGTGMCGGCRVTIGNEVKFACIDGPSFDGLKVDFDEQMRRLRMYREEEQKVTGCQCGGEC
ncbi:sulfide/dihydroorotate dehydrogenase-like FAD/NAD-binding protein [Proteinivorax hydrogeniformans]|uniref:Sulfide/dihydroorotate dehydrogenase-like FAD/NAD-binding protein n=1 Tax=Proteinivorax hydrogeniformans TaxID=1826727 RepID=A0AAU8HQM0_9FIRM